MAITVDIDGFPHVQKISLSQIADGRPGKCVVESTVDTELGLDKLPRHTDLTIGIDNNKLSWKNMRVVKISRIGCGMMRTVLEDSRWRMREVILNKNYNERNFKGEVLTDTKKSVSDLVEEIKASTGLPFGVGKDISAFQVPAKWAGRNALDCLMEMVWLSGSRVNYDPASETYWVTKANTGIALDISRQLFRPSPNNRFKTIRARSHPILYEDSLDCKAVRINKETGEAEDVASDNLPVSPTEEYGQTRYRLWQPTSIDMDTAVLKNHRTVSHLFDPVYQVYEQARMVRDEFERYPHHEPLLTFDRPIGKSIEVSANGKAFLTDNPVMMTDSGGTLLKTCKIVAGYYKKSGGDFERVEKTKTLTEGLKGEVVVDFDWIRPIDSTQPDSASLGATSWSNTVQAQLDAITHHYEGTAGKAVLPGIVTFGENGRIGGVEHKIKLGKKVFAKTIVAVNYIPSSVGDVE